MRKQKIGTPNDPNIKTPKIRKFTITPSSSQTQPSQLINSTPVINPTIAAGLDHLTKIWNHAKKNEIPLRLDQTQAKVQAQLNEKTNLLAEANTTIENLEMNLLNEKKEHEKMAKFIAGTCKTRDAIIENQNLANNLSNQIYEHIDAIINVQEHCEESKEHLTQLYNNVALKQQDEIQNLTEQFNDRVSKKKAELQEQFDYKYNEMLVLETEYNKLFQEVVKKETQLLNEINTNVEEYEVMIDKNKKKHVLEAAQMSETIKEKELNLQIEQEAKYKLEAEYNESSEKYDVLLSKNNSLKITDSDYQSQIKDLTSVILELKEEEINLNNEHDELKNNHLALLSNKDLESAEYRKKLTDLIAAITEASDKLKEAVSNDKELLKIVTKTEEEIEQLENSLKTKDDEIMKICINLSHVLDNNKELNEKIKTQNQELITIEKQICENRENFDTHETKRDKTAKREAAVSEELAQIEQQLSEKSEESGKLLKEIDNERLRSAEEAKKFKQKIGEKSQVIARENKANEDLEQEIGRKQCEDKKKIQEATHLTKQCKFAAHEKQIKEQNIEIDILNQNLTCEKLKYKLANEKKNATEAREKEMYEVQVKKLKSNYEDLKMILSTVKQENEGLLKKLKQAKASIEAKNTEQETISVSSTVKSILKLASSKSPLKVQKVQFDLPSSLDLNSINISQMFEESERRYAASTAGASTTNWGKIQIPISSDELNKTSPAVKESQAPQPKKFFKQPRLQTKKTYQFGKK